MQYYADCDDNGNIKGYYYDVIHTDIPSTAIPISESEWQDCINHPNKYIVIDGTLTEAPPIPPGLYLPRYNISADGWVEGLTPEEVEAIRNAPPTTGEKLAQLQTESVDTMLALTEVYETNALQDAQREQEGVDTMIALTEAYELILQLTARIESLEAAQNGGAS